MTHATTAHVTTTRRTSAHQSPDRPVDASHTPAAGLTRRALVLGAAAVPLAASVPALAGAGFSIAGVEVRATSIVRARVSPRMIDRVHWRLSRFAGARGGRPVRVVVSLHTIDPYSAQAGYRRGVAVRYTVLDAATGRALLRSRFLERTRPDERFEQFRFRRQTQTRWQTERQLADRVARQIAREVG